MRFLGDRTDEPEDVKASRRRAVVRKMLRIVRQQRQREVFELGLIDLGGEC